MTVANRPAFGLQTAYFGNALTGKSSAVAPQVPALQTAPQFGCEDKVQFAGLPGKPQFAGQSITRRFVLAAAGAATAALLAGCGGAAMAGGNGPGAGSGTVATSTAGSSHGDMCASGSISKDEAYKALSQQSGLSATQLQAKLKNASPNVVYGLSLLSKDLITQVLAKPAVMSQLSTVKSGDAPAAAAALALNNLVANDAKNGGASNPQIAGDVAAVDLVSKLVSDGNTKAFTGGGETIKSLLQGAQARLEGQGKLINYTGLNKNQVSAPLKQALMGYFGKAYHETAISFTMGPVGQGDKALIAKLGNAAENC